MQKKTKTYFKIISLFLSLNMLHGCITAATATAAAIGAGAGVGVYMYQDRRTPGAIVEDQKIEIKATAKLLSDKNIRKYSSIAVNSFNHVVLITGQTSDEELMDDIHQVVTDTKGVNKIYNEVTVEDPLTIQAKAEDAYITAQIKTKFLTHTGVSPLKIKVVTENKTVYLLGLVTKDEAKLAVKLTNEVEGINNVVKIFESYYPPE